jgi:hypothetical protein
VAQLFQIQEAVIGWGGDPRNPYSDDVLQRVYEQDSDQSESSHK